MSTKDSLLVSFRYKAKHTGLQSSAATGASKPSDGSYQAEAALCGREAIYAPKAMAGFNGPPMNRGAWNGWKR